MIQNDKWIKEQCTPPRFVVTELVSSAPFASGQDVYYVPRERTYLSHLSAEEIQALIRRDTFNDKGIKSYRAVTQEDLLNWQPMIAPFEPNQVRTREQRYADVLRQVCDDPQDVQPEKIVSYGTSSFGYDIRCSDEFKIFTNIHSTVVDPKNFDPKTFVDFKGEVCIIPPNSFALARTVERFKIPRNVMTICLGKSTYARCGIIVNVTPFEPGWEGYVTLEFSNTTPLPAKIYANEGCAQVLFFQGEQPETSYADRQGKYQGQTGVVPPRI